MATHSSILAWRIPWTEESGGLQSTGSQQLDTTERLHFTHLSNLKQIFFLKCCLPFDFVIKFDLGKRVYFNLVLLSHHI